MKPLVLASIEDETGDRCVDILRLDIGQYAFRECRSDPEDGAGWRYLSNAPPTVFDSETDGREAAAAAIGWMRA